MVVLVGIVLLALGLLSGVVLVLAALGLLAAVAGLTLWALFPILCIAGFLLVGMQAQPAQVRTVSVVSSALLLLLALASIVAIVLGAAALIPAPASAAALWFVLVIGGALGLTGAAAYGRSPKDL